MDTQHLKQEVEKYILAMEQDGKTFKFFALEPVFPYVPDTAYFLKVKADWIDNTYTKDVIDYMIDKMFDVLDISVRAFLDRIDIIKPNDEIDCGPGSIIIIGKEYNKAVFH